MKFAAPILSGFLAQVMRYKKHCIVYARRAAGRRGGLMHIRVNPFRSDLLAQPVFRCLVKDRSIPWVEMAGAAAVTDVVVRGVV